MTAPSFDFSKLPGAEDPWGPSKDIPQSLTFSDVPYAPFSKTDKLGKVADWQQTKEDELPKAYQQKRRDQYHAYGASAAKLFGAETEEDDFSIVDNNAVPANKQAVLHGRRNRQQQGGASQGMAGQLQQQQRGPGGNQGQSNNRYQGNQGGWNQGGNRGQGGWNNNQGGRWGNQGGRWGNQGGRWNNNRWGSRYTSRDEQTKNRDPSVKVGSDWQLVTEIEMSKLTKLNLVVPKAEPLDSYGSVNTYNRKYEQFKPEPLKASKHTVANPTTLADPVIKELASDKKAAVFATDSILAQLMCTARSAYSWDLVVSKRDGAIYFDKRAGSDSIEVDENAPWPPQDSDKADIDSSTKLAEEAALINNEFLASCLESTVHKFDHDSPFADASANEGYRYVKYSLPTGDEENPLPLILRAKIDSFQEAQGKTLSINALNQYNPTTNDNWKTKLITGSRGVIFAGELKKNNNKIARWATQSILGGIDAMKIGFVTRQNAKDNTKHVVAGALSFTPQVLASQINLSVGNGWGVVKSLIDIIDHEGGDEDYRFVLFKAPGVSKLAIYKVPNDTFDDEL